MKKICPKCNNEHQKPGTFCCRSCANSRNFSPDAIEKKRLSGLAFYSQLSEQERKEFHLKKTEKFDWLEHQRMVQEKNLARSWSRPYEKMNRNSLRKRILHERNYKCEECGISNVYNGKPLSLEMDHIDGDSNNNSVENLRILCPNCHSQTPTHRGKNIQYKKLKESHSLVAQR